MRISLLLLLVLSGIRSEAQDRRLLRMQESTVVFVSEAPLERISAINRRSSGIIDMAARTFAVQVPVADFEGFNSPLQREHFKENYMDERAWPNALFQGRIIEDVDLSAPGVHEVRAKGRLNIRGVVVERIVPCRLRVTVAGVRVECDMEVPLDDHGIRVPRVVRQKIAPVVHIRVDALFTEASPKP
ncbi:MAG: hypothetical protein KIT10_00560 [Flavobacteriales bacterium]|nr:hypothetical protein [Flavobacteriales bacterium]